MVWVVPELAALALLVYWFVLFRRARQAHRDRQAEWRSMPPHRWRS